MVDQESKEISTSSKWPQYYSSFAACLAVANVGTALIYTATAIPDINSEQSAWQPLNKSEQSWISAIVFISGTLAGPLVGTLMEKLGVRASMMTLTFPLIGGWLIILFSTNFWMLFAGRFITGFCSSGAVVAVPVFIAETTQPEIRGKLGIGYEFLGSIGRLYLVSIGYFASWRWQAVACAILPVIFQLLMLPVPESPRTLISQGKLKKARRSLGWFRNAKKPQLVQEEFDSVVKSIESGRDQSPVSFSTYMSSPILKPTLICAGLMFFVQTSGCIPLVTYSVYVFEEAGFSDGHLGTIAIGVTQVIMSFCPALLVDRVGRRILLMVSGGIMALNLMALGTYMYFQTALASFTWIPLVCLMLCMAGFSVGLGSVPFLLVGELVPTRAKGFSSAVALISTRFFGFLVVLTYNDLVDILGDAGSYWFFAGCCVMGIFYVYSFIPETKGKSLEEIQSIFQPKSVKKISDPTETDA